MNSLWLRSGYFVWICAVVVAGAAWNVAAQEPQAKVPKAKVPAALRPLVPHRLLALVHAPEVQQELELTEQQLVELEKCFARLDGPWFRNRIQPADKQIPEMDRLETEFSQWARSTWSSSQLERLEQLEIQALGSRMVLRSDVAARIKLTAAQSKKFAELAKATDLAQAKLQQATLSGKSTPELEKAATSASEAEQKAWKSELTAAQWQELSKLVGPIFDTAKLTRVYPMAPELASDTQWLNSEPLTLKSLRGKVVLVHFYAFQCHNCHANFEIYRRWHQQLRDKGVVVIGIQSPETERERDPEAVRQAAIERKLDFPIIVDTDKKNWDAWANTMWPTVYVVDKQGYLRHWWQGELNWQGATGDKTIESIVEKALAES